MKKLSTTEEKMNGRTVVIYSMQEKSTTPSRLDLQVAIAKKEKAKPELTVVESINVAYGTNNFEVKALIYDNADDYKRLVPKSLAKKSVIPTKEEATEEASE